MVVGILECLELLKETEELNEPKLVDELKDEEGEVEAEMEGKEAD